VDDVADPTKCILYVFEHGFIVGVVARNQYEACDRFEEEKVVKVLFKARGKRYKPDLLYVLVLSSGSLFHMGKFVSTLACIREVRNNGKSFIFQVEMIFLAMNIVQKTNNPFPCVISI